MTIEKTENGVTIGSQELLHVMYAHCQTKAEARIGVTLLVTGVQRATEERYLAIGRTLWKLSGRDVAAWDKATVDDRRYMLGWCKSHMGKYYHINTNYTPGKYPGDVMDYDSTDFMSHNYASHVYVCTIDELIAGRFDED